MAVAAIVMIGCEERRQVNDPNAPENRHRENDPNDPDAPENGCDRTVLNTNTNGANTPNPNAPERIPLSIRE